MFLWYALLLRLRLLLRLLGALLLLPLLLLPLWPSLLLGLLSTLLLLLLLLPLRLRLLLGLLRTLLLLLLLLRRRLSLFRLGLPFVPLFLLSVTYDSSGKRNQRKQIHNSKKFHIHLSFFSKHQSLKPEARYLSPQPSDFQQPNSNGHPNDDIQNRLDAGSHGEKTFLIG